MLYCAGDDSAVVRKYAASTKLMSTLRSAPVPVRCGWAERLATCHAAQKRFTLPPHASPSWNVASLVSPPNATNSTFAPTIPHSLMRSTNRQQDEPHTPSPTILMRRNTLSAESTVNRDGRMYAPVHPSRVRPTGSNHTGVPGTMCELEPSRYTDVLFKRFS